LDTRFVDHVTRFEKLSLESRVAMKPRPYQKKALNALHHRLCDTFGGSEARRAWLRASNRHLGGLAPADAMRAGRVDRVDAALEALDSGVYV
jgi:hypothetical protein